MKKLFLLIVIGFAFASCGKEKRECPSAAEKTFTLAGFTKVTAAETFAIKVTQGAAYSIKAKGCSDDLADLDVSIQPGGFLRIQYNGYKRERYKVAVEITQPAISGINLAGAASGTITGFGGQITFLRTILSGTAQCTIDGLPPLMEADNSGTSVLNLSGTTNNVSASFSGDARLNAYTAAISHADIYTAGTAKAYVTAQQSLIASATGASRIYYKGTPASVQTEESGTGKVIHE